MMDISKYAGYLDAAHDKTVALYQKEPVPSDDIGTDYEWQPVGTANVSVHPVTDELSIELYGERIKKMFSLHAAPDANISDGMGVAFDAAADKPDYTVISAKPRQTHLLVLVEVI
jgi:hypothetical protein